MSSNAFASLATVSAFQTVGELIGKEIAARNIGAAELGTPANLGGNLVAGTFIRNAAAAVGGYAGAEAGGALFDALGIDARFGRLVGASIGATVTSVAVAQLAKDAGYDIAKLGLSTSFEQSFETSLPSLGVAAFEQLTGYSPTVNAFGGSPENVQIGSSIGGAIGAAALSWIPVAGTAIGTVIGQFVGGLVGSMFGHQSVGPNAGALIDLNTNAQQDHNAFAVTYRGHDNGASAEVIATINGLADAVTALLNAEMNVLAGGPGKVGTTLTVGSSHGVQVRLFVNSHDGQNGAFHFYDELTGQTGFPNATARDFGRADGTNGAYGNLINDAVMRQLALDTFSGGDLVMVKALRTSLLAYNDAYASDALAGSSTAYVKETIGQLNYDLQSVQDYDLYQQNKVAFLVGYALRHDATVQAEQQRAQEGGYTYKAPDVATELEADLARGGLLQNAYTFAHGGGAQVIQNYSVTNGGNEGFLTFAQGIKPSDVTLSRSGDDLVLTVAGTAGDQVTILGAFADLQHSLAQIRFNYSSTETVTTQEGYTFNVEVPHADTFFGPELTAAFPPGLAGPYALTGFRFISAPGSYQPNWDHSSIIVHADGAALTNTGDGNTVVLTGRGSSLNLAGQGTTVTSNGNQDVASLSGDQVRATMNGTAVQLYLSGSSGTLTVNGGGSTIGVYGNDDVLTANGDGMQITVGGQRDQVSAGDGDITVNDWTTALLITGESSRVRIGSHVDADVQVLGDAVTLTGTASNVRVNTKGGSLTDAGTGSTVLVNTQETAVAIAGSSANATVNGQYNTVSVAGAGNTVAVNGQDNSITFGGTSNTLGTAGNTVSILDGTTGATLTGGGTSVSVGSNVQASILTFGGEKVTLAGSDTTLTNVAGGYGTVTVTGQRDTVTVEGPSNKVVVAGAGNTTYVSGYAPKVQVSGTAQVLQVDNGTVTLADGAQVTVTGYPSADGSYNVFSNGNRFVLGANVSLQLATGGNNYVEAGSGDAVSLNGTGNGLSASGTGNLVTISGTGSGTGQDGYARMGGSTLVLKAGGIATLTGDGNAATVEAGATLHVAGTGTAATATGATLFFDGPAAPALPSSPLSVRGFGFPAAQAGDYDPAASAGSLAGLAATGANAVELVVTQFLTGLTATTISATGRTESDANLLSEIAAAKAKGLQVLLKPHIDTETNQWRALLQPSDPAAFFANYKAFIVHYAQIAQQAGADQFCIGAELQSLTGAAYRSQWLDIIEAVRQAYAGPITYASAAYETGSVAFWDKVDVIGANAYERLSTDDNPSLADLEAGWTRPTPQTSNPIEVANGTTVTSNGVAIPDPKEPATKMDGFGEKVAADGSKTFYSGPIGSASSGYTAVSPVQFYQDLSAQYGKQVLFTEAGYASVNATNKLEGDGLRSRATYVDYQQQVLATQAFLDVFTQDKGSWLQGAYLWYWNPNTAGVTADDSSVQDKPALDVVKHYYGATPASPAAVSNAVVGSGNVVTVGAGQTLSLTGSNNLVTLAAGATTAVAAETLVLSGTGNTLATGLANAGQVASVRIDTAGNVLLNTLSGNLLLLAGMALGPTQGPGAVTFADGTSWSRDQVMARAAQGSSGAARPQDFDGDRRSDVLIQNDNGTVVVWTTDGLSYKGGAVVTSNVGAAWHAVGSADYNGDGRADILLQHDNGTIVDYLMDGTAVAASAVLGNPGSAWHVRGCADFTGDGRADVLLQHDTGALAIWATDGSTVTSTAYLGNPGAAWHVEGVADYSGDGKPDILMQNDDGSIVVYTMQGTGIAAGAALGSPGSAWHVVGSGDYTGDGKADVVLRDAAGSDVVWATDGSTVTGTYVIGNPGADYTILAAGDDYTGDGRADLLVENTDGKIVAYGMDGAASIAGNVLGQPGAGWRALSNMPPMQFINGTDANTTLSATPGTDEFVLTTAAQGLHQVSGFDPTHDLVAFSKALFPSYAALQASEVAYQGGTYVGMGANTALVIAGVTPDRLGSSNFVLV